VEYLLAPGFVITQEPERALGDRLFGDRQRRTVYVDGAGRQYVRNDRGKPVYGVWLLTDDDTVADVPHVVDVTR